MICCTLGFVAASGALAPGALRAAPALMRTAAAVVAIPVLLFFVLHASHYAERATLNGRSLLAEIAAQPLCSGSPYNQSTASTGRF